MQQPSYAIVKRKQKDMFKEKILILYHSGAGSTKFTSEMLASQLKADFDVTVRHINFDFDYKKLYSYDLLVFGFPTYHCEPSTSMMDFINQIPKLNKQINIFFFTSYGLYTGNSLRIFYHALKIRKFNILGCHQFKSPASDGVLMLSSRIKYMFRFEKNYTKHIKKIIAQIKNHQTKSNTRKPLYKWYVPLNELAKYFAKKTYDKMRDNMYIVVDDCINCALCVELCERKCWTSGMKSPSLNTENCEFCLECIHKCPQKAIIYSKKMRAKPRLDKIFFSAKRKKYINELKTKKR